MKGRTDMFTGIVEELGRITAVERTADAARLTIEAPLSVSDAAHGDSIAVSGVCLTVVEREGDTFTADVMQQTLDMSTLSGAAVGLAVNLERATSVGDRLGGHIVQGHVDGTGTVLSVTEGGAWRVVRISLGGALAPLVVDKGSIAVDGVSLTVSSVSPASEPEQWFEVSLIPETLVATTLGARVPGDTVNLETDILARHVQRMLSFGRPDVSTAPAKHTEGGSR
jgi:riboflavin synthase